MATGITDLSHIFLRTTLGLLFLCVSAANAQTPAPSPVESPAPLKSTHALLDEVREGGYEEFQKREPASAEEYREYVQLLTRQVEAETLEEDGRNAARTMREQTEQMRKAISDFKPPEITPDNGLGLYDSARIDGWQAAEWVEALQKIGETRGQQAENAFAALKTQQQKLQAMESGGTPATPRDQWLLKLQQARVQAAFAEHTLRSDKQSWQTDAALREAQIQLAKLKTQSLEGRVSFPPGLLLKKLAAVGNEEDDVSTLAAKVGKQFKNLPSNNTAPDTNPASKLLEDSIESQLQLLEYRRLGLLVTGQIWQTRHDLWNNAINAESLALIEHLVADRDHDIRAWQPLTPGIRGKLQDRIRAAAGMNTDANPQASALDKALKQEEAILSQWENGFSKLSELIKLTKADLASRRKSLGVADKVDAVAFSLGEKARDFWNTGIFTLNDSVFVNGQIVQRPSSVTLGMLLIALGILLLGGIISGAFSHWLRRRLGERFALDATTGAIVQKFSHMILLGLTSLIALAVVKIPLTIFALLGGGAAIAVGFGAQQLVNNLLSGIILLFERPIRIGDIIDVDAYSGTVASIGTRCCQLRRADGVEILIPNSVLLQSTVVNWTLSDNLARQEFTIGLAHGSPVKKAMGIVHAIVSAHPGVVKDREVSVFFHDFAKESLVLRIFYWIDKTKPQTTNGVPSEIRLAIYEAFQNDGILLALPQRDIHLDASNPLAIQILQPIAK